MHGCGEAPPLQLYSVHKASQHVTALALGLHGDRAHEFSAFQSSFIIADLALDGMARKTAFVLLQQNVVCDCGPQIASSISCNAAVLHGFRRSFGTHVHDHFRVHHITLVNLHCAAC